MYDLKIFDNLKILKEFINNNKIIDYKYKSYKFEFKNKIKINYFLSYKFN